jgi:hypothetical protein
MTNTIDLWNIKTRRWDTLPLETWEAFFRARYKNEHRYMPFERYMINYGSNPLKTDPTLEEFLSSRI